MAESRQSDLLYDYELAPIPMADRKSTYALVVVYAGFFASAFNFFLGGLLGGMLPFGQALGALLVGGAIVVLLCSGIGLMSFKRGLSTYMMTRATFGRIGQVFPSFVVALTQPAFAAGYGAAWGLMINRVFPAIPWWVGTLGFVVLVTATAIFGFKGLAWLSAWAVPLLVVLVVYATTQIDFSGLLTLSPANPGAFGAAVSLVIGGWAAGATVSGGDVGRYAGSRFDAVLGPSLGFLLGAALVATVSIAITLTNQTSDLVQMLLSIGMVIPSLAIYLLLMWTTADNIIYAVSLSMSNIEDVLFRRHRVGKTGWVIIAAIAIAALAILAQAMGFTAFLQRLINSIALAIPPFAGILIADYHLLGKLKRSEEEIAAMTVKVNGNALIAWILAIVGSYLLTRVSIGVPAINSLLLAVVAFVILEKLLPHQTKFGGATQRPAAGPSAAGD